MSSEVKDDSFDNNLLMRNQFYKYHPYMNQLAMAATNLTQNNQSSANSTSNNKKRKLHCFFTGAVSRDL